MTRLKVGNIQHPDASVDNLVLDLDGNIEVSGSLTVDSAYKQASQAMSALDVDCSTGNYFTKSISTSSAITFSNIPASGTAFSFTLELALSGASTAITWPAAVRWNADTAPTITDGKTHLFLFTTSDGGTTIRGAALVDYTA